MPLLSKEELLERLLEAMRLSGWTPILLSQQHPFRVRAVRREESASLLVYIWNVTPGGPPQVRPAGEMRIQMTGVSPPLFTDPAFITLLLGWHEDVRAFAGYDVNRHKNFSRLSPSIQVREDTLREARLRGLAPQRKSNDETVVGIAPDELMNYALRQPELHLFRGDREVAILDTASRGQDVPDEDLSQVSRTRRETVRVVTEWVRQRRFRTDVLAAYNQQCAMCHLQLKLVVAAHIIPVGCEGSNDLTPNGLALCPLHHEAYDAGLLGVAPNYHIVANMHRLADLVAGGLGMGEDTVSSLHCTTIVLPQRQPDRPRPEYLREGLRLRGWPPGFWTAP
jgi:putative restriction endonuclease